MTSLHRSNRIPWGLAVVICFALAACGGGGADDPVPPPPPPAPSALTYSSPQIYTVGSAIAPLTPGVVGSVAQYSVSPALPTGLGIDTTSGQITGTPTTAAVMSSFVVTASNNAGSATFALSLIVQPLFLLEPHSSTTIGAGQTIQGFVTLRNSTADPFPGYLDPGLITWSSAQPVIASTNTGGVITGLSTGSTIVTAQYQTLSAQLEVRVRGARAAILSA